MKTSIISKLESSYSADSLKEKNDYPYCRLQWRMGQLLVKPAGQSKHPHLPALDSLEKLTECLQHSPVNLVRIDPQLGENRVRTWTEACEKAGKPIYLNISKLEKSSRLTSNFSKPLQQVIDTTVAITIFVILSPIFLLLLALMQISSPGEIFDYTWHVGKRGKIFKLLKFQTKNQHLGNRVNAKSRHLDAVNFTLFGFLLEKSGLENLPQLINIIRGEISLFGHHGWSLENAVVRNRELIGSKNLLNIPSQWQVESEPGVLHLDSQIL